MKLMDFTVRAMLLAAALTPLVATTRATAATVPAAPSSEAASFATFTGRLWADNDVALFGITLATTRPSIVTFETVSYAGGTMKNGQSVSRGGFDPMLSVFNSHGTLVEYNDDSYDPSARPDPVTSLRADARLDLRLRPGDYTLAVTQFFNNPHHGLEDGFSATTDDYTSFYGCSNGRFCDVTGANRTSDYAVQVSVAPVPVPAALPLLGSAIGILGVLGFGRRRRALA